MARQNGPVLTLDVSESDSLVAPPVWIGLGRIDREPYEAQLPTHSPSHRITRRFMEHVDGPEAARQQLNIVLTPALPDGVLKLVPNDEQGRFATAFVGLSPDRWNATPPPGRYRC